MSWIEKFRMHFAAAAFAEEGEYETAARMAGVPAPAQAADLLQTLTTSFAAAAFAEEGCPEIARQMLSASTQQKSFLELVGLKGVRVYYGRAQVLEPFAESIGLAGVSFKMMTVRL